MQAWEDFARTIHTPAAMMDAVGLREHGALMLTTIVADLECAQTALEQSQKSQGLGARLTGNTFAEIHAADRLASGYTIDQLVSEYRALRASVLKLWAIAAPQECKQVTPAVADDVTRFNEAIDQALAESVARYCAIVSAAAATSQRRLEAILEAVPVGIALADENGTVTLTNAENRKIWGVHPSQTSKDDYDQWQGWWADGSHRHGKRVQADEWPIALALRGTASVRSVIEIEPFGMPGVRRTLLLHGNPILDCAGKIVGAVVAQTDITGQVKAETALIESEAKFETIANAMPQMVWSTLPDGFHDYFNRQWYEFTGVPAGTTDGEGWNNLFHPDDQARAWEAWRHCLATGASYEIHYRLRHHSGAYRWVLGRALPVLNDTGEIMRWMGTCTDIHDQKLAEKRLQDESERKDEFLAMLAHELRNPLAPIASAAHILRIVSADPARVEQTGAVIERQVKHMTNLVDDLLDVSRVTRGLVTLATEELDLKLIVASAIEQVRPLLDTRKHELVVHLVPGTVMVAGDRTRLVQVIANLLNNAAKYTAQHGKIVVAVEVDQQTVSVAVTDNGAGIAATLLPHIFDPFTQGERTPDRIQGGLGLGLALVKSLTFLHGGTVTAASGGGGAGSTFTLRLPLLAGLAAASAADPAQAPRAPERAPLRVMVVDDNIDAAQSLGALLKLNMHEVVIHESALAALGDPVREQTDVFILDIGLPGMDGHDLARRLRSEPATAGAVIIALTGYGQAQDRMLTKAAGFDHHFVKPVDFSELDDTLRGVEQTTR